MDLGTLGGRESGASDIDERGRVVGSAETSLKVADCYGDLGAVAHAFLWENGTMQDLGTVGDAAWGSGAWYINENGQVVGVSDVEAGDENSCPPAYHAFLWQEGGMRDLGTLGGDLSEPAAVNDRGQIVGNDRAGYYVGTYFETKAFLWTNGRIRPLGTRGGSCCYANDINGRGQIVGEARGEAFLWRNGRMRRLGKLGGRATEAVDINERGWLVGRVYKRKGTGAFLWRNGRMVDLGTLGGRETDAVEVNERGWVIGTATKDKHGYVRHAFVWLHGRMIDLGTLGGRSSDATAINDEGQIVGWATTKSGNKHAVVWDPTR